MLERDTGPETPGRPSYRLTSKGRALSPVMTALMQWGDEWSGVGEPPVTLVDLDTDSEIEPVYVDRRTGRPLSELRLGRRLNG